MAGKLFISIDFGTAGAADTKGDRPYQGTQPIYLNSSIFLAGGISKTETRIGRPTTIKVRVSNNDQEASVEDVRVDAYVMNPHVGLATPSQAKRRLRSRLATITPGSGANVDSDPHVRECFIQGPAGEEAWLPTAEDMAGANHLCVIANCYADGDGNEWPDGQPFEIATNQHHGQRNIQVLAASGFTGGLTRFFVMPPPEQQRAFLEVVPVAAKAINEADRDVLASHPAVKLVGGRLVVPGDDGELHPVRFSDKPLDVRLDVKGAKPGKKVKLPKMTKPRRAELELRKPFKGDPGLLNAVEITQRDEDGTLLGSGLRVLTLITAETAGPE